jgi:anti-sigma regulatory factor (Ser/Thr protein kinase)
VTSDLTITLPSALLAPAHARAWVAEHATGLPAHVVQDALLVVSELVTNAVRHGRPDIVVSMRPTADGVRVAVQDAGPELPAAARAAAPDMPSGRGLLIVEATAARWGVEAQRPGPGKTVWAELGAD